MVSLTWAFGIASFLGVGGTIAALVFFPTVAMPILEKLISVLLGCKACLYALAFLCAVLASYWYGHHGEYKKGYEAALSAIAAEDAAAIKSATEKRAVWKECQAQGGTWDQSEGKCW